MSSHILVEGAVKLIQGYIQDNIKSALIEVSADCGSPPIAVPLPKRVFTFTPGASPMELPCVIIEGVQGDFRLQKGANFIDALWSINVAAVIEEKGGEILQYCAYRYQAALQKLLQGTHLYSAPTDTKKIHIVTKVERCRWSGQYTDAQKPNNDAGRFMKEVLLELEVEHYENST